MKELLKNQMKNTNFNYYNQWKRGAGARPPAGAESLKKQIKSALAQKGAAKAYFWTIFGPEIVKSREESVSGAKTAKFGHFFCKF